MAKWANDLVMDAALDYIATSTILCVCSAQPATHVGLGISGSTTLVYVTTCTSQQLTANNTVTVPAWDVEIADPA